MIGRVQAARHGLAVAAWMAFLAARCLGSNSRWPFTYADVFASFAARDVPGFLGFVRSTRSAVQAPDFCSSVLANVCVENGTLFRYDGGPEQLSFCDEHGVKWAKLGRGTDQFPVSAAERALVLNVVSLSNPWHALHWLVPGAAWAAELELPGVGTDLYLYGIECIALFLKFSCVSWGRGQLCLFKWIILFWRIFVYQYTQRYHLIPSSIPKKLRSGR